MSCKTNYFVAFLVHGRKNIFFCSFHSTHNCKLIIMRHTWLISSFKRNPLLKRKQTPWSEFYIMSDFQYISKYFTKFSWKCCQHLQWFYSTDKESAQYNTLWLCGMHLWLRGVKWLNYTTETVRNNRYIVQRTLIISEYSKHPHFKASQNIKLRARIDLLMILWLSRWICTAVS
jgi:hypothetical protein